MDVKKDSVLVIVQNSSKFIDPILFCVSDLVTFFIEDRKLYSTIEKLVIPK